MTGWPAGLGRIGMVATASYPKTKAAMISRYAPGFGGNAKQVVWFPPRVVTLFHHELNLVARLQCLSCCEAVEHEETLQRPVGDRHTGGKPFRRVGCRHGHHLDAQGLRAVDFRQRHAPEAVDRVTEGTFAFGRLVLGGKDEPVHLAAETHGIEPELPLVAFGRGGRGREAV